MHQMWEKCWNSIPINPNREMTSRRKGQSAKLNWKLSPAWGADKKGSRGTTWWSVRGRRANLAKLHLIHCQLMRLDPSNPSVENPMRQHRSSRKWRMGQIMKGCRGVAFWLFWQLLATPQDAFVASVPHFCTHRSCYTEILYSACISKFQCCFCNGTCFLLAFQVL